MIDTSANVGRTVWQLATVLPGEAYDAVCDSPEPPRPSTNAANGSIEG
jgi:hypothetical protein